MNSQDIPLSPEAISIIQVWEDPNLLETAITMYRDTARQFLADEQIDPFANYRLTRAAADAINLADTEEDYVTNGQAPTAVDLIAAESEIAEIDKLDDNEPGDDDLGDEEDAEDEEWAKAEDPELREENEEDQALHVPKRFGRVWTGYAGALEAFWTRAQNLNVEEELYEGHKQEAEAAYKLITPRLPKLAILREQLTLVDRFITVISAKTLESIRKM